MDEAAALVAIQNLRSNLTYQDAEKLRRKTKGGAATMADAPENSAEYAAIQLLINTWETIATLVAGVANKDPIYEVTPICHVYNNLKEAFTPIGLRCTGLKSVEDFDVPNAGYGAKFAILNNDYNNWMIEQNKSGHYVTGAHGGIHAMFG
jgi:hypothetical protein